MAVFDNAALCSMSKRLMLRLKYKHLYLYDDLVQIFLFGNGLDKVKNSIITHREPGNGPLYPGLIEYCFYEELKKDKYSLYFSAELCVVLTSFNVFLFFCCDNQSFSFFFNKYLFFENY